MGKKTKNFKPKVEEPMTPLQKAIIGAFLSFFPFFFFILLPWGTRTYINDTLKIPPEVLAMRPQDVNLVQTGIVPATLTYSINGVEFAIPRDMTPVQIRPTSTVFRSQIRKISRTLSVGHFERAKDLDLRATGIIAWFVPSKMHRFFDAVLYSTWHPARILCKAQFLIAQGITGQIFKTVWENEFAGYVFPTPSETGYMGRIFPLEREGYVEYSYFDEMNPVTLREWVNFAVGIRYRDPEAPPMHGGISLAKAIEKASGNPGTQWEALEIALNQYYKTQNPNWLLPIVAVQENRGFIREVMEFHRDFAHQVEADSSLRLLWNDALDRVVHRVLQMEIDPHLHLNRVLVHCKNIGDFAIGKMRMKITLQTPAGDRTFPATLFVENFLHAGMEKDLEISPPVGFVVHEASGLQWKVEDVAIGD